ncbi:MAG: methylthioribulose 1-phosphate dehydratase [Spongiibacteraceae bacterium]|jgi:methylthioribulose-1-phosphate dehydratase|nr:methylthioribulose 1-phosphate dehydratase [Spongiibacteraceae bacterium]
MSTSPSSHAWSDIAAQLASTGRELYQRGWVPATSGNFSHRLSADRALVTASGRHKGRLGEQDFLVVDLEGRPIAPGGKPSAETLLHTQLYQRLPRVNAVLHCHSPLATVMSRQVTDRDTLTLADYELLKAFPGIDTHAASVHLRIFDNTQDIGALAREVDAWLADDADFPCYLIRGHGVYTWAETLEHCERQLEALDFLLSCELEQLRLQR